ALITADLLCVGAIVYQLRSNGYELEVDLLGQARIAGSALITLAIGMLIHSSHPDTWFWNIIGMGLTGLTFIVVARILRPMVAHEREMIERMAGRRIFVI
ncbi:MAG: hypothetical protein AAF543_09050, partial [Pseudomonadota bacterium]